MTAIRRTLARSDVLRALYHGTFVKAKARAQLIGGGGELEYAMTTRHEWRYFRRYARRDYTGVGEIVDLGSWMGSTTIPLARGLRDNPAAGGERRIHAYDLFVWDASYMDGPAAGTDLEGRYQDGDSFLDAFERFIEPWSDLVVVHPGDICALGWSGEPIEFLLVDAMKSVPMAECIPAGFYPHLLPQRSIVLHQDFAHYYTPWIHLLHHRLRDHFELVTDVPRSGSTVFRLLDAIPADLLDQPCRLEDFDETEVERAFALSASLVGRRKRPNVMAAKVMYYVHTGDPERARRELDRAVASGLSLRSELGIVAGLLDADGVAGT